MPVDRQQEMQQKVMMYQILQGQLEEIRKQATMLQERFSEIETSRQALDDLSHLGETHDTLIPLGNGMFASGTVKKGNVLVNVGAGVLLKKSPTEAIELLNNKMKDVEQLSQGLQKEATEYIIRLQALGEELTQESQKEQHKHE